MSTDKTFSLAILVVLFQGLVLGCSADADKPVRSTSKHTEKASSKGDYKITTFGSSNLSPKEAIERYMPKKFLARGITYKGLVKASDNAMDAMDYEAGAVLANEAIKKDPTRSKAYYLRGRGIYNGIHGSSKNALKDFLKATELGDKDGRSYEYVARIYTDQNQPEKAIKAITKAIKTDPGQRDFYKYRAALYAQVKDFANARKDYDLHIAVAPNKLGGYIERARFSSSMEDYDGAIRDYSKVIELTESKLPNPSKQTYALRLRAAVYSQVGKHKKAISDYSKLIKMEKNSDELYRLRGVEYTATGDYENALKDFNQAIELAPEFSSSRAYAARSKVYKLLGKDKLARQDEKKANDIKAMPAERNLFKMEH